MVRTLWAAAAKMIALHCSNCETAPPPSAIIKKKQISMQHYTLDIDAHVGVTLLKLRSANINALGTADPTTTL